MTATTVSPLFRSQGPTASAAAGPSRVDFDMQHAFTRGDCWHLAHELNQRFGFQLVFVVSDREDEDGGQDAYGADATTGVVVDDLTHWYHALVRLPDLRLLDIEGPGTASKQHWLRSRPNAGPRGLHFVERRREVVMLTGSAVPDEADRIYPSIDVDDAVAALVHDYPDCFAENGDHAL